MKRKDLKPGDVFRYEGFTMVFLVPGPAHDPKHYKDQTGRYFSMPYPEDLDKEVELVGAAVPPPPPPKSDKPDMVNAPPHYTRLDPQPIEVIEAWGLDFFLGSAIKYIARAGHKGDAKTDLLKAISFLKRKVEQMDKPVGRVPYGASCGAGGMIIRHEANCDQQVRAGRCDCGAAGQ